jgi:hypothetical protein
VTAVEFIAAHDVRNALARAAAAYKGPVNRHWYEPGWNNRLQKITDLIESGETELLRVVDRFRGTSLVDGDGGRAPKRNVFEDRGSERLWFGARVRMKQTLMVHLKRALINAVLYDACCADTESVVELGAGDGLNLFEFWLAASPRRARYMAFEIASTGRLCTELLATLEPRMRVSAHAFDYYSPRYDEIPNRQKHMLVFTVMSIEQIAKLPKAVIESLLDKAAAVSGVHFEPVAWQLPEHDNPVHKRGCFAHKYNQNLWSLLTELQQEGRIAIDRVAVDLYGRTYHPTSLIQWHKI